MNVQPEVESSGMDVAKLVLAGLVAAAGIVGFYYFEEQSQLLRVLGLLAVLALAALLALQTTAGRSLWRFGTEARTELRKVVWPSRQETIQTTLVVMVVVLVMALFLWLVDSGLIAVVRALIGGEA
jgi:preprotein translocase subunit SecE